MNIFSVDAETNGLYGDVWAIGAVVLSPDGKMVDSFSGQVENPVITDQWVLTNIVPYVSLPKYKSARELRDAFWSFWMKNKATCLAIADYAYPVESNLFRLCINDDVSRTWDGPYPLHEVATLLYAAGIDPNISREEFSGMYHLTKHNPLDDAYLSALTWIKAKNTL